ncbi:MAG: hypothetical protein EBR60_10160, partial [Burkholderiaceae bacterium]|nr:hypothetical protein [Burkholderiaceae bacterium]
SNYSGSVIDGYVSGATVFIDLDNDKTLDWVDANADGQWTVGEGEAWTTTDSSGTYTFASGVNAKAGSIVSLGGTDITTGAAITILTAEAGSQYITPISTAYVSAGSSGAALLASMGLSAADLLYDPVSSTSVNATTVLKTGSSLLTIINNASALATELGGISATAAANSAFSTLANLSSTALTNLFGTSSAAASASMTSFLTSSLNSSGIDTTNYSSAISATASSVTAITTALQGLSAAAVKSGELYQLAASGQSTLMADIKSLGSAAAAGEDLSTKILSLQSGYTSANLNVLKAASAARLAFNTQDPTNPITTTADTFTLEAPVSGAPIIKLFNPLSNDKMTGSGSLGLAAVGLFDTKSFNGSIKSASNSGVTSNKIKFSAAQSAVEDFYKGMAITLLTASGPVATTITSYNGQTKEATLGTTLSTTVLNDITTKGASYLVSKAVPANISFAIVNDKIQITNTYDKDYEFGQLDLIYVAQQVGNPQVAKTGLATVNIQPPIPTVSHLSTFATGKTLQVTEAITGAANQKTVNVGTDVPDNRIFTEIALPLKVSGLGVTGNLQIQGLPTGSYLSYTKADGTIVNIAKDVGSPNWTIGGANALDARIYSTLKLLIPSDLSADYALKIFATSRYGGLSSRASESVTVSISANADGLLVSPGSEFNAINALVDNTVPAAGVEDTAFGLVANEINAMVSALTSKRIDSDSEKLGLRIELPTGFNVSFTNPAVKQQTITASDGKVTVQLYESDGVSLAAALQAVRFTPKGDFSGTASIQIFAGTFEPSLAINGIPTATGPGALKLLANPFSASIRIAPVSDLPVLEAPTIVLKDGTPWSQDHSNYKLADGRYRTSIKTKVNSSDVDGSENVYVDIRKAELSEAGAVLDVGGKTEIIQIKQSDLAGRAISFLSSATGGNVSDLVKSGTGTAQVEITQGSTGVKEVAEVIFNNLSAGKTIGFGGLVFTAGSSGATASQIAEAFASKAVGFSANNTAVPGGVLSGTLSGWGTGAKETVWYRVDTGAVQSVDVIAPSTTAKPISIFLRPAAVDSGAGLTATSTISPTVQSLTIPFEDRPATPSLTVIPTATGLEDQ